MEPSQLNFDALRLKSVIRCEDAFRHHLNNWSVAEWGTATAGECGEACNIAKKMLRFRDHVEGNSPDDTLANLRDKLAEELADVVIYTDLWAASQGIDLAKAVIDKFNKTSDKIGSEIKL